MKAQFWFYHLLFHLSLLMPVVLPGQAYAAAGNVDLSFDPGSGVYGTVRFIAVQPDGKVLIAGEFTSVRGLARSRVARLHPDGSGDASFDATGTPVSSLYLGTFVLQPDGKMLAGHDGGITRLHADGSHDSTFKTDLLPVSIFDWPTLNVQSIALQSDGKVLAAGVFQTEHGGTSRYNVVRLHPDGRLDESFKASAGGHSDGPSYKGGVGAVACQADGKVVIGGWFTSANGAARQCVARFHADGSLDNGFDPGNGLDGFVRSILLEPDGKLVLAGSFTTANGANRSIARLNSDGGLDGGFRSGSNLYDRVLAVSRQTDGKLLVAGSVNTFAWAGQRLTRLHPDGSKDSGYLADTAGLGGEVSAVALLPDGRSLIGGDFSSTGEARVHNVARLTQQGRVDQGFHPDSSLTGPRNSSVRVVVLQPDGKVLVAGWRVQWHGSGVRGVTRLHPDGRPDAEFVPSPETDVAVTCLALQPDGRVLVGNDDEYSSKLKLVRLQPGGALDSSFAPDFGAVGSVQTLVTAIALQPDGKVLVAGRSLMEGLDGGRFEVLSLTRIHANGSRDTTFEPAMGLPRGVEEREQVTALTLQPDGKVLVGGFFRILNGVARRGIARLHPDGKLDLGFDGFDPGTGPQFILAIGIQTDGKVLIGGNFASVNGAARNGLARLNPNGSVDSSFVPTLEKDSVAFCLLVQPDGRVLAGGLITPGAGAQTNLVRLQADGGLDPTFNPGSGADDIVESMARQGDGRVVVGGDFALVNQLLRRRIARLHGESPPPLGIALADGVALLSWPVPGFAVELEQTTDFSLWSAVAQPVVIRDNVSSVSVPLGSGSRFFRLKLP